MVKSDGKLVSTLAKDVLANINSVKNGKTLIRRTHCLDESDEWFKIKYRKNCSYYNYRKTAHVVFMDLSTNFYALLKVSKQDYSIYYQNCPMYNDGKGANWLSKENAVKKIHTTVRKCLLVENSRNH